MIKNLKTEEVDSDPQTDTLDLSDGAIARIRNAHRYLEEDFRPSSSLFSDDRAPID